MTRERWDQFYLVKVFVKATLCLHIYSFFLYAEGLSTMIRKYAQNKLIHGVKICRKALVTNHMLFADDSYIYCRAIKEESEHMLELLHKFENASSQKVNLAKSTVFFNPNVTNAYKNEIYDILHMQEAGERSKYLGFPNMLCRNKTALLGYLKERVKNRVRQWDGRYISKSGKEILIKTISQALPSFGMSVFLLPLEITRDIERTFSKYWWSSKSGQDSEIHWRFLTNPNNLVSKLFSARYYQEGNFLDAGIVNNPSYVWQSIWEAKSLLKMGVRWLVGSGEAISITNQPWLAEDDNPYITSTSQTFENNNEVIRDLFNERDQQCILRVSLNNTREEDRIYWRKENSGIYSIKSGYNLLQEQKGTWRTVDNGSLWSKLWKIRAPPKTLNLVWRDLVFCLPTMTMLAFRHVLVLSTCPVCNGDGETILHAMVTCLFVVLCWQRILPEVQQLVGDSFEGWLEVVLSKVNFDRRTLVVTMCWAIWKVRNEKHWNQKVSSTNIILALAKQYLVQWKNAQDRSTEALVQSKIEGDRAITWVKPQVDTIKVTVDGSIFHEQEAFGLEWWPEILRGI